MSKKAKRNTADPGIVPEIKQSILIAIDCILPCPWNKRRDKEAGVKSLSESIAAQGLLNPIIVRNHPTQKAQYEILAGERRWRACSLIWSMMPAVNMGAISDTEARQITTIENLQREELSLFEQAEEISELQLSGMDSRSIASKIGKSITWVAKRARLNDLSPEWKKEIGKPTGRFSRWTPAHFESIARYDSDTQKELFKNGWHGIEAFSDLEKALGNMNKKLSTAPWKLDDEALVPKSGACSACQKRASCQPELFAGTDDAIETMAIPKNDRCLDKECWGSKLEAYHQIGIAKAKEEHGNVILMDKADHGEGFLPENSSLKKSAVDEYKYESAKPSDKKAVAAYIIDGKGAGSVQIVKLQSWASDSKPKKELGENGKPVVSKAEREAALNKRRMIRFITKLMMLLRGENPDLTDKKAESTEGYQDPRPAIAEGLSNIETFALVAAFGASPQDINNDHEFDRWTTFKNITMMNGSDAQRIALFGTFNMIIDQLRQLTYAPKPDIDFPDSLCAALRLDREEIWSKVLEEIPVPKSWEKLEDKSESKPKKKRGKKAVSELVDEE
jgi:ParB/RepB/Spo0J family partition protein